MNLFLAIVLSLIGVGVSYSSSYVNVIHEEWETYKVKHGKTYDTAMEDALRLKVYMDSKLRVVEHNQKYYEGSTSFLVELNFFSDMLPHEWTFYKGLTLNGSIERHHQGATSFIGPHHDVRLPESVDWRKEGAVTPVKNQQKCGSCWAFSATGSLEGQHFRKTNTLVSLSEQNLVDCVVVNGTKEDCNGGFMTDAFMYIKNNSGIDTERSYPYRGVNGKCHFSTNSIGATDKGFAKIKQGDELALMQAIALVGPISVSIDASNLSFLLYRTGVYYEPRCKTQDLDHAVLAVGYGTTEDGQDYWLVKNSWTEIWGDKGYIKMARNRNNHCGIASFASYPLV